MEAWLSESVLGKERFEHTAIGIETSRIEDGVISLEVVGNSCLQLLVDILSATDETHRRHAKAAFFHHPTCSLDETRMIGETEIIVGAEIEHFLSSHADGSPLRTLNDTLFLVKACLTNFRKLLTEMLLDFRVHINKVLRFDV